MQLIMINLDTDPSEISDALIAELDSETLATVFGQVHAYLFPGELSGDCPHGADDPDYGSAGLDTGKLIGLEEIRTNVDLASLCPQGHATWVTLASGQNVCACGETWE